MKTIIAIALAATLILEAASALRMPNPNQPRLERYLEEKRRAMKGQQRPPPPNGGGGGGGGLTVSGRSDSTQCTTSSGACALDGSSNYVSRSLSWDASTGKFSGTMVTNVCSNNAYGYINYTNSRTTGTHTAACYSQTFPAPDYTGTAPFAAPTRGNIGYSLYGVNMYGPFEAGFTTGQACDNSLGDCAAGLDLAVCEDELKQECGVDHVSYNMLMDTCGGHANAYHYHTEMFCDEQRNTAVTTSNTNNHSPLVGIALDGYGIYGAYESGTTLPTDLDACGGHYGPVPGSSLSGVAHAGAQNVYHYHAQQAPPFLLGCFGPVSSVQQCRDINSANCGSTISVTTTKGTFDYDDDCPCFYKNNASNVMAAASTSGGSSTSSTPTPPTTTTPTTTPTTGGGSSVVATPQPAVPAAASNVFVFAALAVILAAFLF